MPAEGCTGGWARGRSRSRERGIKKTRQQRQQQSVWQPKSQQPVAGVNRMRPGHTGVGYALGYVKGVGRL